MPDNHKAAWLALRHAVDALESAEYLLSTVRDAPARGVRQQIGPLREQVSRWSAVLELNSLPPDAAGQVVRGVGDGDA